MEKVDCSNIFNFLNECARRNKELDRRVEITAIKLYRITKEDVAELQKWSDEHPQQTRKDKFDQMCRDKIDQICRDNGFAGRSKHMCSYPYCIPNSTCGECKEYWNEVVE